MTYEVEVWGAPGTTQPEWHVSGLRHATTSVPFVWRAGHRWRVRSCFTRDRRNGLGPWLTSNGPDRSSSSRW